MGKLNVITLMRAQHSLSEGELFDWSTLPPSPPPALNHKVICDTRLEEEYLKATVKWAQEETKSVKVDPIFKHLAPEARQIRSYDVNVWFWKNTPFVLVFTDSRIKIHEVQVGLKEVLGLLLTRVTLHHDILHCLLRSPAIDNVYELEFRDPAESSGVSSITVSGHSLGDSELVTKLVSTGQELARIKVELVDANGTRFLASVGHTGLVVLSPYVRESQVKTFIGQLVACLSGVAYEP